MNTQLQQLIEELTAEKEKAKAHADMNEEVRQWYMWGQYKGQVQAFSLCVKKLTLFFNSENDKIGKNDADNIGKPV